MERFIDVLSLIAIPILLIWALISFIKYKNNKPEWINPLGNALMFAWILFADFDSNWIFYSGLLSLFFSLFLYHIVKKYKMGLNMFNPADTSKKTAKLYQITLYSFPIMILLLISLYFILPQKQ
ncbi:hypothetical protein [Carnobacterium pleistocenium]|uniref:hypothetical protein n=1 Tax=Carnobacterium pleistocenium TaxID=181073 RepID=UPI0005549B7C|nr:hypothetical protein [Carnobacterium pleistocenium]